MPAQRTDEQIAEEIVNARRHLGYRDRQKEALLAALTRVREAGAEAMRESVAKWMIANSFATGHGDTLDDLLTELGWQLVEKRKKAAILTARVELLREAHTLANGALRSAMNVAKRDGRETNWPDFRASLRASLDASHAAMAALDSVPITEVIPDGK